MREKLKMAQKFGDLEPRCDIIKQKNEEKCYHGMVVDNRWAGLSIVGTAKPDTFLE